jgi:glutathione S-transferase
VLAEKGLESQIEFVSVDLVGAEHKGAAFLEKNPSGVLPVLQLDDGTYISESTAITEYLDNLDGKPTLTGRTPREKAMIHMMQRRAEAELLDAVGNYFHHATPGLGAALQVFKSPEWSDRKAWGDRQRAKAEQGMVYFDRVLKANPYVAGENFSMADITVFAGLMFADAGGIPIPEDCTALLAWRVKVSDLPSVKNRSGQAFVPEDLRRLGF